MGVIIYVCRKSIILLKANNDVWKEGWQEAQWAGKKGFRLTCMHVILYDTVPYIPDMIVVVVVVSVLK